MICKGKIGLHEGIELELMLSRKKMLALFFNDMGVPGTFLPYIERGVFRCNYLVLVPQDKQTPIELGAFILFRPVHQKYAGQFEQLLKKSIRHFDPMVEREIGKLLGYQEEDILLYINNCKKELRQA